MPSQDMVLGCYYLTANNPSSQKGAGHYFSDLEDVIIAYEQNQIDLHAYIWVRFNGKVEEVERLSASKIESKNNVNYSYYHASSDRFIRSDVTGQQIVQYIRTTAGRILFNKVVQEALSN